MATPTKIPDCPYCPDSGFVMNLGKRYPLYPAGCVVVIGFPFAALHQAQLQVQYRCKICQREFLGRSIMAWIFWLILFLIVVVPILWVLSFLID